MSDPEGARAGVLAPASSRRRRLRRGSVAAGLLVLISLFAWSWCQALDLRVERVDIPVRGMPASMEGLTILLVADLHVFPVGYPEEALLRECDRLHPDLVLLAGDYASKWGTDEAALAGVERLLPRLHARLGLFAVRGNHDSRGLADAMGARGIRFLYNESVPVDTGRGTLWIGGVDDSIHGCDDIAATMSKIPAGAPSIVMSHTPAILWKAVSAGVPVLLAGHTHGGQVCCPGFGAIVTGTDLPNRYASGLHLVSDTRLYVTRGVGTTALPVRFGCPPEITWMTLRAEGR